MTKYTLAGILLAVTSAAFVLLVYLDVHAVAAAPIAANDEPEPCEIFAKAGVQNIYRCIDWEMDSVCYFSQNGFMFCLKD